MKQKRITLWMWLGFSLLHGATVLVVGSATTWLIGLDPFLDVALILGVLVLLLASPFFGLYWSERFVNAYNRRIPDRYCPKCSYDLTGNVSGICPECGRAVDQAARKGDTSA